MSTIGDLAIVNRTTETAPKDYTVPGAQNVLALAVTAAIDGSGAAGSYLPCLQLMSPAGDVLWTARTASSFAAGQSVDVSWFARAGGITSSVSSANLPWAIYTGEDPNTVPAPPSYGPIILGDPNNAGAFYTSDSSIFGLADNTLAAQSIQIKQPGIYLLHGMVQGTYTTLPASSNVLVVSFVDPDNYPIAAPALGIYRSYPGQTSGLINLDVSTVVTVPDPIQGTPAVYGIAARMTTALANPTVTARVFVFQVNSTPGTLA